jgi:hypothetical protein
VLNPLPAEEWTSCFAVPIGSVEAVDDAVKGLGVGLGGIATDMLNPLPEEECTILVAVPMGIAGGDTVAVKGLGMGREGGVP